MLGNEFLYPHIGDILHDQYNKLTWIVGEEHFSVILNGEVRFCGVKFPYMDMNLHLQIPQTIIIGTNGQGKKLFRSIKISQLKTKPKTNTKQGELIMNVKQSNNILPNVRQIVHPEYGENYWFNGCAAFLMECLGEKDFDYWFFAGLTDENFTQFHSKDYFRGNGIVDYNLSLENNHSFIESIFAKIGYASTNVPIKQLLANREMYIQTVISYIDKGTPVILSDYGKNPHNRFSWGVLVGYEDYGKTLLYIGGDGEEPDRIAVEDLLPDGYEPENNHSHGWLFIGEKKEDIPLEKIFRDCILTLPEVLSFENSSYCFGAKAFREWASKIEKGYYNGIKAEEFDPWGMYTVYICALATNSGGCKGFLEKAFQLNPDLTFIPQIIEIYTQTGRYWNNDNGTDLEALNGGFNVTLNALQNKEKRGKIAAKLLEFAKSIEDVMVLIKSFNRDGKAHNL